MSSEQFLAIVERIAAVFPGGCMLHTDPPGYTLEEQVRRREQESRAPGVAGSVWQVSTQQSRAGSRHEESRKLGGRLYPIGMIDLSHTDWERHYGSSWEQVVQRKQRFDPDHVLTPGQSIFAP
jgi:hypothetical protein